MVRGGTCDLMGSFSGLAGQLDPRAGPVEPTMKRLDQVEPRRRLGSGAFGVVYRSTVERCVVDSCGGNGIFVECPDDGEQVQVSSSLASSRAGHGLCLSMPEPTSGLPAGGGLFSFGSVSRGGNGLTVSGTPNISSSNFRRNGGTGVHCSDGTCVADNMVCEYNGGGGGALFVGCSTVTLSRCVFNDNTGDGVACSSGVGPVRWMAPECTSSRNTDDGFDLSDCSGAQLVECIASGNGVAGFGFRGTMSTGSIERCSATGDSCGFLVAGQGNLVVGNSASDGPLGALVIDPGNVAGPVIDAAGGATSCNPRANVLRRGTDCPDRLVRRGGGQARPPRASIAGSLALRTYSAAWFAPRAGWGADSARVGVRPGGEGESRDGATA